MIKESISLNDVALTLGSVSLGDGRARFGPGTRAWLFSQFHCHNVFKSGGGLEERSTQETLGDRNFDALDTPMWLDLRRGERMGVLVTTLGKLVP